MFVSPLLKLILKLVVSFLSLCWLYDIDTQKYELTTPFINHCKDEVVVGYLDRITEDKRLIIIIEDTLEEIIFKKASLKFNLSEGDYFNLVKINNKYQLINKNQLETHKAKLEIEHLMNQLKKYDE